MNNNEILIIFDDIVNSFDYKNKYAMIEYIKDLSNDDKINIIILTHNFLFYRKLRHTLKGYKKLLAYNNGDFVQIFEAKSKEFDTLQFMQNWKNNKNIIGYIALIPMARNVIEIVNKADEKYNILCNFLHYRKETEELTFKDLKLTLNTFYESDKLIENPEGIQDDNKYLHILEKEVDEAISKNITETDLKTKVLLGIYIRIMNEKMLYKHLTKKEKINITNKNYSNNLYKKVKDRLTEKEKSLYNISNTIAPSFLHVNSFMYEPLVDIGVEKIIDVVKKLKDYHIMNHNNGYYYYY